MLTCDRTRIVLDEQSLTPRYRFEPSVITTHVLSRRCSIVRSLLQGARIPNGDHGPNALQTVVQLKEAKCDIDLATLSTHHRPE